MRNDPGTACMDYAAWQQYQAAGGTSNRVSLAAVKHVMPLIMEKELTPQQRRCMQLFYFDQKSQTEIAQELGVTQPTVSRILKTARRRIKKYLHYARLAADKASALLH